MSDSSPTAVYRGEGITTGAWRAPADGRDDPVADHDDMTGSQDGNAVRLEGETGEAYGDHVGSAVPNLNVTRVSNPARTHTLPSNLQTSPLTAGARGGRRSSGAGEYRSRS